MLLMATALLSFADYTNTVSIRNTVDPDGKAFVQKQCTPPQRGKGDDDDDDKPVTDAPLHHLTINYTMGDGEELNNIKIYHDKLGKSIDIESDSPGTFEIDWPDGTWDICLTFNVWSDDKYLAYVIKEDVVLDKDLNLDISRDEACNIIQLRPVLHTGEEPRYGSMTPPDREIHYDGANCCEIGTFFIFRKDWSSVQGYCYSIDWLSEGWVAKSTQIYVNSLSDNYYLSGIRYFARDNNELPNSDDSVDMWTFSTSLDKSVTLSNKADDYKCFDLNVPKSPASKDRSFGWHRGLIEGVGIVLEGDDVVNMGGNGWFLKKELHNIYINTANNNGFMTIPKFFYNTFDADDDQGMLGGIRSDYVYFNNDRLEFVRSYNDYDSYLQAFLPGGQVANTYPGNQDWFFTSDQQMPAYSNNAPYLSFVLQINPGEEFDYYGAEINYCGQFGELRKSDCQIADVNVIVDGNVKVEGLSMGALMEGYLTSVFNAETPCKEVKIKAVNENIEIDGVEGLNVAEIKIINGEDKCPPSVQMLAFRDKKSGLRTHNFTAENGELQFSAADLNWVTEEIDGRNKFWFDLETPVVKAEYAPHGSETFVPLDVTEHPDRFYAPCFGAYYTADLKEVATTGWQDLRLTITDAAGNSQTQTLSPAFNIMAEGGIAAVGADTENAVIWHDGVLYTGSEAVFSVFDLSGRKVAAGHGPEAGLSLPAGVYIVVTPGAASRIAVN